MILEILLNELGGNFGTIFFIGPWCCIVDKIMEEQSYL